MSRKGVREPVRRFMAPAGPHEPLLHIDLGYRSRIDNMERWFYFLKRRCVVTGSVNSFYGISRSWAGVRVTR